MAKKKVQRRTSTRKVSKGPKLVTRSEAASALGVEPSRINKWVADGAPVARKGKRGQAALYDVAALREWRKQRQENASERLSLEEERAKLAKAQAEKTEMENAVRRGELVERHQVVEEGRQVIRATMTRLQQVPRVATQTGVIPRDKEPELRRLIKDALRELSTWQSIEELAESA